MQGQQTLQVSSASTPIFRSVTLKRSTSSTNVLEGENNVAEKIKKTLDLLEQSGSKNSTTRNIYDSINESSTHASLNVSPLKINLRDNPRYSSTSPMIIQTMVTATSSLEEQLANLTKLVEGWTKNVQHQESRIYKLIDRIRGLLDWEASHAHKKCVDVKEIGDPGKHRLLVRCQFLLKEWSHSIAWRSSSKTLSNISMKSPQDLLICMQSHTSIQGQRKSKATCCTLCVNM